MPRPPPPPPLLLALLVASCAARGGGEAAAGREGASRALKVGIICALGALVMLSNGAVLAVAASEVSGWSRSSRLVLLSLAAADAALALLVVPLNLYGGLVQAAAEPRAGVAAGAGGGRVTAPREAEAPGAAYSEAYCRAVAYVTSSVFGAALYSLAGVSLERYVAVFFPLRYGCLLRPRRVALLIAAAWLGPALLLLPVALPGRAAVLRVRFSSAALLCEPDYASNAVYSALLAAAIFCPAAATVTFANLRLWQAARSQRRRGAAAGGAGLQRLRPRRLDAASRVLAPVVIAFYVCWAPCMGTILYNAITRDRVPEWVEFVALWLPIGSGFLNCFVYFWTNRSFRHKWRRLTRELCGPCRGGGAGRQPGPAGPRTLSAAVERRDGQRGFSPEPSCSASSASILLPLETRTAV
ncbi:D(4) dopamine receptor [Alligator mississippiensis]|uniref:D(4) dopamine receptor n=1 Tax=Alligator mississippiensis TaxID=8496 RepID=UPI0028780310|nr:D(4) dopamine receptor [Alligator mississippiensis]